MVSRLDRLFILLDTGSSESVRLAAAKQLGEVQRIQPHDLDYLLHRIKEYSTKSVWETRVAAGHATRCVLEQVNQWPPCDHVPDEDTKLASKQELANSLIEQHVNTERVLTEFDLDKILTLFPKLLSSNDTDSPDDLESSTSSQSRGSTRGREYKRKNSTTTTTNRKNSKEQLMRQRQLINKELGIAMVDSLNLGLKSTDLVSNDDLQPEYSTDSSETFSSQSTQRSVNLQQQDAKASLQISISNYDKLVQFLSHSGCISINGQTTNSDCSTDIKDILSGVDWPLTEITQEYIDNLFSPSWEMRHGAAIALREIVRLQGKSAGRRLELSSASNDKLNQLWLTDMALKAICILVLDKFGDFLFDQVVAPVRENAAQLLGCCVVSMEEQDVRLILNILLGLLNSPNWETRHGGILGLKYVLNSMSEDFVKQALVFCFEPIFKCLGDTNDDVSAEAAASLVPVKDLMIESIPDKTPKLIKFLWEHLADLDELTTSTSNIILLLASLITSKSDQLEPSELIKSIPKLWSLMSHSSTAVRVSVLKALITLIKPQTTSCLQWMPENLLATVMRLVFQRSILENMDEVRPYIQNVWTELIRINKMDDRQSQLETMNLLKCSSKYLNYWLCLTMQPMNTPIDRGHALWLNIRPDGSESLEKPDGDVYIASCTFNAETIDQQKAQVTKCRLLGTKLLGSLYASLVEAHDIGDEKGGECTVHAKQTLYYLCDMFAHYLKTMSANQRIFSGWALESWATDQVQLMEYNLQRLKTTLNDGLRHQLLIALQDTKICYDELATTFTRLQQEAREFVALLVASNLHTNLGSSISTTDKRAIYNLNQIQSMCDLNLKVEFSRMASKKQGSSSSTEIHDFANSESYSKLSSKKLNLSRSMQATNIERKKLSTSVLSSLACAHVSWRLMPERLSLITDPLLDSIEYEQEPLLQDKSIDYLVIIFDILCSNDKSNEHSQLIAAILKRLIGGLCSTSQFASSTIEPTTLTEAGIINSQVSDPKNGVDQFKIVLLDNLQRKAEQSRASLSRRQSSVNSNSSFKRSHSLASTSSEIERLASQDLQASQYIESTNETRQRGTRAALNKLTAHFGNDLPDRLPDFWNSITSGIKAQTELYLRPEEENIKLSDSRDSLENQLVTDLTLLQIVGQSLSDHLRGQLSSLFPDLVRLLGSSNANIRHQTAHCMGLISKLMFDKVVDMIKADILTLLDQDDKIMARCGAIEAIALIIEHLQLDLVPRINMFIVHVLKRMSDQNDQVRLMSTHCFGKLLSLMPLNMQKDKNFEDEKVKLMDDSELRKEKSHAVSSVDEECSFIEQLLDPKKLRNYKIPFKMSAELRSYQQDGLNWLAFLNRFNLHGILCDEMGLGKTLMTICMVASDHYQQDLSTPPSLIVCPSTLTEHWLYEIEKFLSSETRTIVNAVIYGRQQADRASVRQQILRPNDEASHQGHKINVIITSYDIVRNDIDFFKSVLWNYCVLDEGHIIKNSRTKLSKALRFLSAKHRLILSGTPIQNNVTELWSLFDFLMPGFLGSERQFNSRYAKPILQSREPKCSARELESGALAMESLHRQVLPFILRRLKEDVLDDLPPKIIQDYYCQLSSLQMQLYEDFTKSKLCEDVTKKAIHQLDEDDVELETKSSSKSHVFQALQYLKNVCNHPKLVLTDKHSKYAEIKKSLDNELSLNDICHSSKLKALKQLLIDCGIGIANQPADEQSIAHQHQQQQQSLGLESVVNQHRALVFCQLRSMVNIIENDLLKKHLPSATYLKLDGSVPTNQRQSIVSRFNNDPSIDLLLLTTQIGGLGLNLTGADTVIFVEHDWNPTKDLQAMDRAHRIGQKKVVNVYRLITKDTLEEKIMGLQKFKTTVSNTVINQDNTGLGTMNVDQLFDLFDGATSATSSQATSVGSGDKNSQLSSGSKRSSSFMDLLPELWDQQQYETEYDLSSFVSSLKS